MNNNGTHNEGNITFKLANQVLLGKPFGILLYNNSVDLAGSGSLNRPLCVINDLGFKGDHVSVNILGSNASTMQASAASDIKIGDLITSNQDSLAVPINNLIPGTYHIVGIAISNASSGELVEFTPTLGLEKTIN